MDMPISLPNTAAKISRQGMHPGLSGKSVLLTGGANGIGLAPDAFAASQAHIIPLDINAEALARDQLRNSSPSIGLETWAGAAPQVQPRKGRVNLC